MLGIKLTYDPAIPFLSTYPEKTKIRKDTIFFAAVFAIARTWKQSRCPSTDEGIKVMWLVQIYNGILLSHKKEQI